MILRLLLFIVSALLVTTALWFVFEKTYNERQFASKEAQNSLEVTEEQSKELYASALKSNVILYSVFFGVMAAVSGFLCHPTADLSGRVKGLVTGLVLGGLAGVASANLGHWFDLAITFPRDPMLYWVERWGLMLLPFCIAVGVAAAVSGRFKKDAADSLVGALLGGGAATIIYCLSAGALTPIENHNLIYPGFSSNRFMILALTGTLVGGVVILQLCRSRSPSPKEGAVVSESNENDN